MMTALESKIRDKLMTPSTYNGCTTVVLADAKCPPGASTCGINVNMDTMISTKINLPGANQCPQGQFFKDVTWREGGTQFSATCVDREDPFLAFGFVPREPAVGPGDVTYTPSPEY